MSQSNVAGGDELTDTANRTVWPTNAVCELSSRTNTGRSAIMATFMIHFGEIIHHQLHHNQRHQHHHQCTHQTLGFTIALRL